MYLVGLTGGIASGKSTVAERFSERGMEIVDADDIAREVVQPGSEAWQEIVAHFGTDVLDDDGFVDRPKLGRIVFRDERKRTLLNEITHPRVMTEIADRLEMLTAFDGVVVVDVPLLVERGMTDTFEAVVVVATDRATQRRRLVENRGMPPDEADARIAAQASLDDKLEAATHVIWNEGSVADLLTRTDEVADELLRCAADKVERETAEVPDD